MTVQEPGIGALTRALLEQGFQAVDEFEVFMTFGRRNELLRIHVAPDGSFAVFDDGDKFITQGKGVEQLHRALKVVSGMLGHRNAL